MGWAFILANSDEENASKNSEAIAVALTHDKNSANVPVIKATGKGEFAEQILQLAFDHGVKVREDADLAQILSEVDVDCPIPLEAFAAVSEILSYLYKSQNELQPELSFGDEQ
jgi:flagellar biosynthesis protein